MNNNDDKLRLGSGIGNWKPRAVALHYEIYHVNFLILFEFSVALTRIVENKWILPYNSRLIDSLI